MIADAWIFIASASSLIVMVSGSVMVLISSSLLLLYRRCRLFYLLLVILSAAAVIILGIYFSSLTQTVALALKFINFILTVVSSRGHCGFWILW